MRYWKLGLAACPLLFAGHARGQAINIDVGEGNSAVGIPTNAYAAAGQAGPWNSVDGSPGIIVNNLVDISGNTTNVSVTHFGGLANFFTNNANTVGDDEALMDDLQDVGGPGNTSTVDFSGLADGQYCVYAYAWAPDDRVNFTTQVTVTGGAAGPQLLGGAWPGMQTQGVTYAKDVVSVSGGTLQIQYATAAGFGSVNGIQIEPTGTPFSTFCTAKTGLVCGASAISASGTSSATATSGFAINASPGRACRNGVFVYGTSQVAGQPFNGGVLCISPVRRAAPIDSGGTAGQCDGVFTIDFNAFMAGTWVNGGCVPNIGPQTNPAGFLAAGVTIFGQMWGRDSVATGSLVSDGVTFVIGS